MRGLYNLSKLYGSFLNLSFRSNHGMMEWWNDGMVVLKRINSVLILIIKQSVTALTANLYFSIHSSSIPSFQYSS